MLVSQLLLADLLTPDRIKVPLESTDKAALIGELATLLANVSGLPDEEERLRHAVLEREAKYSTGIGAGIALPHGKCDVLDELVLVGGRTEVPVDFDALDAQPVRLVMMLVGPESSASLHVKILGRISRLLRSHSVRDRLVECATAGEFLATIREAESP